MLLYRIQDRQNHNRDYKGSISQLLTTQEMLPFCVTNDFQDWFQTKISKVKDFSKNSSVEKCLIPSREFHMN